MLYAYPVGAAPCGAPVFVTLPLCAALADLPDLLADALFPGFSCLVGLSTAPAGANAIRLATPTKTPHDKIKFMRIESF